MELKMPKPQLNKELEWEKIELESSGDVRIQYIMIKPKTKKEYTCKEKRKTLDIKKKMKKNTI